MISDTITREGAYSADLKWDKMTLCSAVDAAMWIFLKDNILENESVAGLQTLT